MRIEIYWEGTRTGPTEVRGWFLSSRMEAGVCGVGGRAGLDRVRSRSMKILLASLGPNELLCTQIG